MIHLDQVNMHYVLTKPLWETLRHPFALPHKVHA